MTETSSTPPHGQTHAEAGTPPRDRVRHEMERWLEVARSTGERALESLGLVAAGRPVPPPTDIVELSGEIVVFVDLPGVSAECVHLSLVGNMLTVKASRSGMDFPEKIQRHLFERTCTQFERSVPLPASVDPEQIRAETRDGLLTVTLKKLTPTTGRSIPVNRAGSVKPAES